jgi:hypothetical protein
MQERRQITCQSRLTPQQIAASNRRKAEDEIFGGNGVPGNDFNTVPRGGDGGEEGPRKGETRQKPESRRKSCADGYRIGRLVNKQ